MSALGSLRARSPSPAPTSSPSSVVHRPPLLTPFSARASQPREPLKTPAPPTTIPSIYLTSATPIAKPETPSTSHGTTGGALAPPVSGLQARPGGPARRVLVPKRSTPKSDAQPSRPPLGTGTWNSAAPRNPQKEWAVVPPPPPPRTSQGPHHYASARRAVPPPSAATVGHASHMARPTPVAILPVKTEDGPDPMKSVGPSSLRSHSSTIRSAGTLRTQKSGTLRVHIDTDVREEAPVLVKKKKSRLALDLGWALGDKTNSPTKTATTPVSAKGKDKENSATPTLTKKGSLGRMSMALKSKASSIRLAAGFADKENSSPKEKEKEKEKWKWSVNLGRSRKDAGLKHTKCKLNILSCSIS